jgi:protocatechuate 3,4-dioxygenase beta subunit
MYEDDRSGNHWDPGLSRRSMLGFFGGLAAAAGLNARGGAGAATMPSVSATPGSQACAVTPEGEIGPYFTDDSASGYNRNTILSNVDGTSTQAGVPLTLTIFVYDTEKSCAAYSGAQVDIWHCNASGVYSNESSQNSNGQTWLRGYQLTDATGKATFKTIVPGWYQGRTTHIHLRVRSTYSNASSTSDGTNTTQLFFPQALITTLATSVAPYNAQGTNATTNANDQVYTPQTKGETLLSPVGDTTSGYTATFSVGLPI